MDRICCDYCQRDLTESMCGEYRLKLSSEHIPNYGFVTADVLIIDPLPEPLTFCGFGCLYQYLKVNLPSKINEKEKGNV